MLASPFSIPQNAKKKRLKLQKLILPFIWRVELTFAQVAFTSAYIL
jgi:hypothetical protein